MAFEPRWEAQKETPQTASLEAADVILKNEKGGRPNMDDFMGAIDAREIASDKQELARLKRKAAEDESRLSPAEQEKNTQTKKLAEAFEVAVSGSVELHDWLGENAYMERTAEYDDRENGVDAVAVFDFGAGTKHVALALDASMSRYSRWTAQKMERNIERVLGEAPPAQVKYFESPITHEKRPLKNIIPVVVGVEGNNAERLLKLYAEIIELQQKKEKTPAFHAHLKKNLEAMRTHPAQLVLLEEIETQLALYAELLAESGKNFRPETKERVEKLRSLIDDIMDAKKQIPLGEWGEDGVLGSIREVAKTMLAAARTNQNRRFL